MADKIGELAVEIIADTSKFNTGISNAKKGTENFDKGLTTLSGSVKKLLGAGALIALTKKIIEVGSASISAASDAQETAAKFSTAFAGITSQAEEVAKNLATNYGLSSTASKQLLSSTGDLVKGFGASATEALATSEEIQKLSVDLASYNNLQGGATQASEILTKAYLGERDSLVSLGIKISENDVKQELLKKGQADLTGQALLLAKGNATLELAMAQSGDAMGDFARTADSYANISRKAEAATEDLKVELSRALLPTATNVKTIFGELTGRLATYIKKVNDLRTAEKAQELGISTKQQDLLLLQEQKKANEDLLVVLEQQASKEAIIYDEATQNTVDQIEVLGTKLYRINKNIEAIEAETKAEAEAEAERIKAEETEKKRLQTIEETEAARIAYKNASLDAIDNIIDASKSEQEIVDQQIADLKGLTGLTEEENQKRLAAIKLLEQETVKAEEQKVKDVEDLEKSWTDKVIEQSDNRELQLAEERATAIAEAEAKGASILEIEKYYDEEGRKLEAERAEDKKKKREEEIQGYLDLATSLGSMLQSVQDQLVANTEATIDNIDTEIESLEAKEETSVGLSDKENARLEALREQREDAANDLYDQQLAAFKTSKALSITETIIAGAQGAVNAYKALAGIPYVGPGLGVAAAFAVGGFTTAQVALINSQPAPAKPAFAQGGVAVGATSAIVGEDRGEVMIGMGAQGAPLLQELSDKIANNLNSQGSMPIVINFNSGLSFGSQAEIDKNVRKIYPSIINEQKRRGVV